ncbi:MAG: lysophospholipid acyltransferase family protein [Alphaproteobacteria bacterium]
MTLLRWLIFVAVAKPFAYLVLGYAVKHRSRLVADGPAIIVANHNSHLDTLLLYVLFPSRLLPKLHPVAAADYFFRTPFLRWVSLNILNVMAIARGSQSRGDPLAPLREALARGEILFIFPEGSRGEPERMAELKTGIAHLAEEMPAVPIVPVFLYGAGRSLPKGSRLFVPFRCAGAVGEAIRWTGDRRSFMAELKARLEALATEIPGRAPAEG